MGIFSDMIRGIITDELKAMAAEDAAKNTDQQTPENEPENANTNDNNAGADEQNADTAGDDVKNDDNMRQMLRKELRAFMAENLNGEEAEGEMPTADDALRSILGFAEKE